MKSYSVHCFYWSENNINFLDRVLQKRALEFKGKMIKSDSNNQKTARVIAFVFDTDILFNSFLEKLDEHFKEVKILLFEDKT